MMPLPKFWAKFFTALQKYTPLIVSIGVLWASEAGIILVYAHKIYFFLTVEWKMNEYDNRY